MRLMLIRSEIISKYIFNIRIILDFCRCSVTAKIIFMQADDSA